MKHRNLAGAVLGAAAVANPVGPDLKTPSRVTLADFASGEFLIGVTDAQPSPFAFLAWLRDVQAA